MQRFGGVEGEKQWRPSHEVSETREREPEARPHGTAIWKFRPLCFLIFISFYVQLGPLPPPHNLDRLLRPAATGVSAELQPPRLRSPVTLRRLCDATRPFWLITTYV